MRFKLSVVALIAALFSTTLLSPTTPHVRAQPLTPTVSPGLTLANVSGTLARGGLFSGTVTITRLTYRGVELVADGSVSGTTLPAASVGSPSTQIAPPPAGESVAITQSFREVPITMLDPDGGACDVLNVDLGTVFLDQTGVQLDPSPTALDIQFLPRASRPLGNLLCTVASLTEAAPTGGQVGLLNELLPVVNRALANSAR